MFHPLPLYPIPRTIRSWTMEAFTVLIVAEVKAALTLIMKTKRTMISRCRFDPHNLCPRLSRPEPGEGPTQWRGPFKRNSLNTDALHNLPSNLLRVTLQSKPLLRAAFPLLRLPNNRGGDRTLNVLNPTQQQGQDLFLPPSIAPKAADTTLSTFFRRVSACNSCFFLELRSSWRGLDLKQLSPMILSYVLRKLNLWAFSSSIGWKAILCTSMA